jgi:ankyrin repeat protein
MTALHTAVCAGNLEAVKALIWAGADPDAVRSTILFSVYYPIAYCA